MSESWRSEPWAQEGAEVRVARDRHGGELPEPLVGVAHGVRAPKRGRIGVHVRLDGGHHLVVDPSQLDCMSPAPNSSMSDVDVSYSSNMEAVVNHPDLGSLRRELEGWIAEADELKSAGPSVGRDGPGPDPAYFLGWHGGRIDMAREVLKWLPK